MRKTKIIATLGPATESAEMIARLIEAGVDVFRLNMSHATHDWVRRVVRDIRASAAGRQRFIGIMMDTQGPAIRTGDLSVPLDLQPSQKFTLTVRGERSEEERSVDVNYANFVNDIDVGDVVLIDNGSQITIPKQPVQGGTGGNPIISIQFQDGAGDPIDTLVRLGRCVQLLPGN